jgi:hypothetical protein
MIKVIGGDNQDKYWSGYETTERMNVIHDRVGHGKQAWDMILDEAKKKNGWRDKRNPRRT